MHRAGEGRSSDQPGWWGWASTGCDSRCDRLWWHFKDTATFWGDYVRTSREPGVSVQRSLWHRLAQRWVQCVHRHGADSSVLSEVELLLSKLAATGLQQAAPQVKVNTNNCSTPLKICIERENEELWKEYPAANTDTATTSTLQCSRALQTKGWTSKNTLRNVLLS